MATAPSLSHLEFYKLQWFRESPGDHRLPYLLEISGPTSSPTYRGETNKLRGAFWTNKVSLIYGEVFLVYQSFIFFLQFVPLYLRMLRAK